MKNQFYCTDELAAAISFVAVSKQLPPDATKLPTNFLKDSFAQQLEQVLVKALKKSQRPEPLFSLINRRGVRRTMHQYIDSWCSVPHQLFSQEWYYSVSHLPFQPHFTVLLDDLPGGCYH
jgi:hypothetical protein